MIVPFLDLKSQNAAVWEEIRGTIDGLAREAQFILGPHVERFEESFSAYCGAKHCVGLNNGTTALHMALLAFDIGVGDEVITTPHSWISTSWAIAYTGATPVFVDIDRNSYNLDPELVEAAITSKTKAILPVHLYGHAADMTALRMIGERHHLRLIEDAAQAHGARHTGKVVGSIGDAGCFSFYPGKNLGAFGEAGAVVTNSDQVAQRIRRLRDHAQDGRHNHVEIGYNTRMEGLQGAVLDAKLMHLPEWTLKRREHAHFYLQHLQATAGLTLPTVSDPFSHVWHLFVVLVDDRDRFRAELEKRGIATGVHYPTPIPYQPAFKHLGYQKGQFPVTEDVMSRCVSLPMFPELTTEQRDYVVAMIREVISGR